MTTADAPILQIVAVDKGGFPLAVKNDISNVKIQDAVGEIAFAEFDIPSSKIGTSAKHCALGNTTNAEENSDNILSFDHAHSGGTLLVAVATRNGPITSITFDGNALTLVARSGTSGITAEIWRRYNTNAGKKQVVINNTGNYMRATAVSVINGDVVRDSDTLSVASRTSANLTLQTEVGDLCIDVLSGPDGGSGNITPNTGQESLNDSQHSAPALRIGVSAEYAAAGSTSMGWTMHSEQWAYAAVAIQPVNETEATFLIGRDITIRYNGTGAWEEWDGRITQKTRKSINGVILSHFFVAANALELQKTPVYDGINLDSDTMSASVALALQQTPAWSSVLTGAGYVNMTERIDTLNQWATLKQFAQIQNAVLRHQLNNRVVEFIRGATPTTPTVLTNVVQGTSASKVGFLEELLDFIEDDVVNRVTPRAVKEGNVIFDLSWATRNSPYDVRRFLTKPPTITNDYLQTAITLSKDAVIKLNSDLRLTGNNRSLVAFMISDTSVIVISFIPPIEVQGGGEMRASGEFITTPGNRRTTVYRLSNAPEGDILLQIGKAHPDVDLEGCTLYIIGFQDSYIPFGGVHAAEVSGTGSSGSVGFNSIGPQIGDLCLCAVHTDSLRTFTSNGGQTRLFTQGTAAVDYKYATSPNEVMGFSWGSSTGYGLLGFVVRQIPSYYIQDDQSVGKYGLSAEVKLDRVTKIPAGYNEVYIDGSNTLYDKYSNYLLSRATPPRTYKWKVGFIPGTMHDNKVGDTIRTVYKSEDENIDETLYVVQRVQTFDSAGIRHWEITTSTAPRLPRDMEQYWAEQLERILSIESVT